MSRVGHNWKGGSTVDGTRSDRRNAPVAVGSDVIEQLRQLDCDPITGMAKIARDDTLPTVLRARMFAELATYVAPRRKAVELTGANGSPIETKVTFDFNALSTEELKTLKDLLRKAGVRGADDQV
jgi:hypothetical protein